MFRKLLGYHDDNNQPPNVDENENPVNHPDQHSAADYHQSRSGVKPATPPVTDRDDASTPSKHISTAVRQDDSDNEMYVQQPEKNVPCDINQMALSLAQLEKRLMTTERENSRLRNELEHNLQFKPAIPEAVDPGAQNLKIPIRKINADHPAHNNNNNALHGGEQYGAVDEVKNYSAEQVNASGKTSDANATYFLDQSSTNKTDENFNEDRTLAQHEAEKRASDSITAKRLPETPPAHDESSSSEDGKTEQKSATRQQKSSSKLSKQASAAKSKNDSDDTSSSESSAAEGKITHERDRKSNAMHMDNAAAAAALCAPLPHRAEAEAPQPRLSAVARLQKLEGRAAAGGMDEPKSNATRGTAAAGTVREDETNEIAARTSSRSAATSASDQQVAAHHESSKSQRQSPADNVSGSSDDDDNQRIVSTGTHKSGATSRHSPYGRSSNRDKGEEAGDATYFSDQDTAKTIKIEREYLELPRPAFSGQTPSDEETAGDDARGAAAVHYDSRASPQLLASTNRQPSATDKTPRTDQEQRQRPTFSTSSSTTSSSLSSSSSDASSEINDDVRPLPKLPPGSRKFSDVVAASHQQFDQEIASSHKLSRQSPGQPTVDVHSRSRTVQSVSDNNPSLTITESTISRRSTAPHGNEPTTYYSDEPNLREGEAEQRKPSGQRGSAGHHVANHSVEDAQNNRSSAKQSTHASIATNTGQNHQAGARRAPHEQFHTESGNSYSIRGPMAEAAEQTQHLTSINPQERATSTFSSSRQYSGGEDQNNSQFQTDSGQKYSLSGPMADVTYPARSEVAELDVDKQSISVYKDKTKSASSSRSESSRALREPKTSNSSRGSSSVTTQRRRGVRGETTSMMDDVVLERVEKDRETKQLIRDALKQNAYLRHLDKVQIGEMVEYMYFVDAPEKCWIVRQGEVGNHLYVLGSGSATVTKDGKQLCTLRAGTSFGEHAMLHSSTRTASVRSVEPCQLWVLDRKFYKKIMVQSHTERRDAEIKMLKKVPTLSSLSAHRLKKLADALEVDFFSPGDHIMRQDEVGDHLCIILHGEANVTQKADDDEQRLDEGRSSKTSSGSCPLTSSKNERVIKTLKKGDYFGEKALEGENKRTMSVIAATDVECLMLHRDAFVSHVGRLQQSNTLSPHHQHHDHTTMISGLDNRSSDNLQVAASPLPGASPLPPLIDDAEEDARLFPEKPVPADFKILATLGVGAFGRVVLVQHPAVKNRAFALKIMKKVDLVKLHQQEHVKNEKDALLRCHSPFICKLYFAMKDSKRLYFVRLHTTTLILVSFNCTRVIKILFARVHSCLNTYLPGGELWSKLTDLGRFNINKVRFYSACALEALQYLHHQNIVYRDLKPENVILDSRGYGKLVDMGFAKHVEPHQKTWTFCGTPLYIAPEVILHKGHDQAVDFYELGIFTFELFNGTSPFDHAGSEENDTETYKRVLRGINSVDFPHEMPRSLVSLVKSLCALNPIERLGNQRGGFDDIRKHRFFQGFNWSGFESQTLDAPIKPLVSGPTDTSNFDESFPLDPHASSVPDDTTGWDKDF